jgi:hypothetical protein
MITPEEHNRYAVDADNLRLRAEVADDQYHAAVRDHGPESDQACAALDKFAAAVFAYQDLVNEAQRRILQ